MMKLNLTDHLTKIDDKKLAIWDSFEIGSYKVERVYKRLHDDGTELFNYGIESNEEFAPRIYYVEPWEEDGTKPCFKIQTTSYGALEPSEIQKVIAGYQEAVEVVEVLTNTFLK